MSDSTNTAGGTAEKLGLALSGGGFRASFFHIGVLAQMARQGLLRRVEAISTVSGGSILGALYYLHVKKLLEAKPDPEITDQDYVRIVQDIETDFMAATERNIRMLTFADFQANWEMRRPDYSRSDRLADLYNDLLYQSVLKNVSAPVQMRELKIFPPGQPDFQPWNDNAARSAKVPVLTLNATTLNSGRNWRFTAQTMGEPPTPDTDEVDKKPIRLRRPKPGYDAAIARQRDFPLGHAVAASACVPALFTPLAVSDLYRDGGEDFRVQLVDGGVHDNQGVGALLELGCTRFVVSDAAGQMGEEYRPGTDPVAVLLRVGSILQDRVRTEVLDRLLQEQGTGRVAFVHLRKGLGFREISWNGPDGKPAEPVKDIPATCLEDFGVAPEVQELLSRVRTDLDAFTEVEAYSLMLDGYLGSEKELEGFRAAAAPLPLGEETWRFQSIAPWMKRPTPDYRKQLKVAGETVGKALFLIPWLPIATFLLLVALFVYFWPQIWGFLQTSIPVVAIVAVILVMVLDKLVPKLAEAFEALRFLLSPWETVKRLLLRGALPVLGTVFVQFYLRFINPLFLKRGRLEELGRRDG
jgi:NTE family protein